MIDRGSFLKYLPLRVRARRQLVRAWRWLTDQQHH